MSGPMEHKTPIAFTNRKGHRLFGILHEPLGRPRTDFGILLLSPGVKMRTGPECLYRRMTRLFVSLGVPVFRFDFWGLGDSDGELHEQFLKDVYNHVEVGRFVDDALDAMNWMEQQCGTRRFVVSGLCGGAITGLFAAGRDARIAGLLALSITPLLSSRAADPSLYMSSGELDHLRRGYVNKLLAPDAWLRLLTLRSDYKVIWRAVWSPINRRLRRSQPAPKQYDNTNPLFPPAFFKMLAANTPMLLIFGGSDRMRWDFQEKFVERHQERLAPLQSKYEMHVIEYANHVLSFTPWQDEMLDVSQRWLERHFSGDIRAGEALAEASA